MDYTTTGGILTVACNGLVDEIINQILLLVRTVIRHDQIKLAIELARNTPQIMYRSQQIQQVAVFHGSAG